MISEVSSSCATNCIIDLQVSSDTIFFGLGNLGLKIVAMSYEMSLCFGSTQPEPATDVRRRDCAIVQSLFVCKPMSKVARTP